MKDRRNRAYAYVRFMHTRISINIIRAKNPEMEYQRKTKTKKKIEKKRKNIENSSEQQQQQQLTALNDQTNHPHNDKNKTTEKSERKKKPNVQIDTHKIYVENIEK